MKNFIAKRQFKGERDNVFTSPYMTSFKWAAIVLLEPTETHLGGVNYSVFKTKKEAEEFKPEFPMQTFEDFWEAKGYFEDYIRFDR